MMNDAMLKQAWMVALSATLLSVALGGPARGETSASSTPRPNIIFILADDFGPDGLGCYGSEIYKDATPRIDALAAHGMRFLNAYATALCTPSRAQYATGQYPFRNGVVDLDGRLHPAHDPHRPSVTTLLKQAGYYTGKLGKADSCNVPPDEYFGGGAGYWRKPGTPSKSRVIGPSKIKAEDYEYGPAGDLAFMLDFIERNTPGSANNHRPFYFVYGFNLPHSPILPTPDSLEHRGGAPAGETAAQKMQRHCLDNIRYIDQTVGAIVDKLKQQGILDNTLILFSGDNGSAECRGPLWDERTRQYRPLHGSKGDRALNREGSALVPLIIHWPAGIPKAMTGTARRELVDFTDFLPTFGALAGVKPPARMGSRRPIVCAVAAGRPELPAA